jgi:hypothetical protein
MGDRAATEDRYGYWFPLAFLGFGLLGLLGWQSVTAARDMDWFAYAPQDTAGAIDLHAYQFVASAPAVAGSWRQDRPWAVLVTTALVVAVAWYAWWTRRAGGSVRAHVALAVCGGIAVPACYVVAAAAGAIADPAAMVPSVGLPLVGLGLAAAGWAYFRLGRWRRTAAVTGVVCLTVGGGTVLGAWSPGLLTPVLLTGGLLALAWFERSRTLVVVAGAVLLALVLIPEGTLTTLVPAVVVLAAAIVALVRRSGAHTGRVTA